MTRLRFVGGDAGAWRVTGVTAVAGPGLAMASRLDSGPDEGAVAAGAWVLRGVASNQRYTRRDELDALVGVQEGLGRPAARLAALIPIRKDARWWAMAQDERRAVFEASSKHIGIGMEYLPAIARRLLHSRDLGEAFDFLTWFEFAPEHEGVFDELLLRLRSTEEWSYVEREVDIRLMLG